MNFVVRVVDYLLLKHFVIPCLGMCSRTRCVFSASLVSSANSAWTHRTRVSSLTLLLCYYRIFTAATLSTRFQLIVSSCNLSKFKFVWKRKNKYWLLSFTTPWKWIMLRLLRWSKVSIFWTLRSATRRFKNNTIIRRLD